MMRHPRGWIAAGFGAGFSPWAPGTVGSLVAIIPWWLWLRHLPAADYFGALFLAFLVGIWAANWVIRETRIEDPSLVVWDEFVGMWLVLWAVPAEWPWVLGAFVLFRALDIAKPWPVRWADHQLKGGFGTMVDDALAGAMGLAVMVALAALVPWLSVSA